MAWGVIAGAAASAYSAYLARKSQKEEIVGQTSANQANFDFQRESWENDRFNYKHRHQWEVDDLRKANLNPVLSAKFGGATLPPSSATPSAQNPHKGQTANTINRMMTAKQISLVGAQIDNINADTQQKIAQAGTEGFKQTQLSAQADSLIQAAKESKQTVKNLVTERELKEMQREILNVTKHYEKAKPYLDVVERLVKAGVSIFVIKKFLAKNGLRIGKAGIKIAGDLIKKKL